MRNFARFILISPSNDSLPNKSRIIKYMKFNYTCLFGIMDFHTHIRYREVLRVLKKEIPNSAKDVIDIGAGMGSLDSEILFRRKLRPRSLTVLTYEKNDYDFLKTVKGQIQSLIPTIINIVRDDANTLSKIPSNHYDYALIIDNLEHLASDDLAVKNLARILKSKGRVIVSVPTYAYVSFFGKEFDKAIGHLRHYTSDEIRSLFERNGFKPIYVHGYTSRLNLFLCSIYYNRIQKLSRLCKVTLPLLLLPLFSIISIPFEHFGEPYGEILAIFEKLDRSE